MAVVNKLFGGYGEAPTNLQGNIASQGNAFLKKRFPKLDAVLSARRRQALSATASRGSSPPARRE